MEWQEQFRLALGPSHTHLDNGDPRKFDFAIDTITLTGGQEVALQRSGVTVIVGANNTGKSTILREISDCTRLEPMQSRAGAIAVQSIEARKAGEERDLMAWLGATSSFRVNGNNAGFQRGPVSHTAYMALATAWKHGKSQFGPLAHFLLFYGDAEGRLRLATQAQMRDSIGDPPEHPVHYLQDDKGLMAQISSVSEEVFGVPLTLDTLARSIRLRIGRLDLDAPPVDDVNPEYRQAMGALPSLDVQGDGMRSFMGQLLSIMTGAFPIVLLDEPEAFLHPPQAYALGAQIGSHSKLRGVQSIVATHDRNFLTGVLSSGVEVTVLRLERTGDRIEASRLDSAKLGLLWRDPLFKYANVLEGLFHRLVVLAEAHVDCAFLGAALDCPGRVSPPVPRNEILFVPTGGKGAMAKTAAALSAVGVPVVVAPDLDMLSDEVALKQLVEAVGGVWTAELSRLWNIATTDIRSKREPAKVSHVLGAVETVLKQHIGEDYSEEIQAEVRGQLRTSGSRWGSLKVHGMSSFDGAARVAADRLLDELDSVGVVLVRDGELERLAPEVATSKGSKWLGDALDAGAQCNDLAQAHVDRILAAGNRE